VSSPHPLCSGSFGLCHRTRAFLIGSRLHYASSSETYRFTRSEPWATIRRSLPTGWTPLMGFIDSPLQRHTVLASTPVRTVARTLVWNRHVPDSFRSCRSSRLQRFTPQGSSFRRSRTSTARRFVAPCSRSGGPPRFQLLCSLSTAGEPSPVHVRSLSLWRIPFEAFSSPVAVPLVTALFFRRLFFRRFRVHRTACLSRRLNRASSTVLPRSPCSSPTSGLCSTGESVARVRRFRRTRLDAPMGF